MKKAFVLLIAVASITMFYAATAWADIAPKSDYSLNAYGAVWTDVMNGVTYTYTGYATSTHPQGVWNSPSTQGIDGYNYNDPQDYITESEWVTRQARDINNNIIDIQVVQAGPHGGYLTTTHRCRECHAVHRAAGRFKLTRANTRFEVCEWCHGLGAGSGINIQMDNNDSFTSEYNVGHTLGYGVSSGKWKAPDDTYPAYTPTYWLGGFSCFDCHSPHANPQRLFGFSDDGLSSFSLANPGHDNMWNSLVPYDEPRWPGGSWLLLKNPDNETDSSTGNEISDLNTSFTFQFARAEGTVDLPVNKIAINWNTPIGLNNYESTQSGTSFHVAEFCTDCHDGNAGSHTIQVALFSEDRALRDQLGTDSYDIGYGHDSNSRQCGRQMVFDSEDGQNYGPNCRNCHKATADCDICHSAAGMPAADTVKWPREAFTTSVVEAVASTPVGWGGPGYKSLYNEDTLTNNGKPFRNERTVKYYDDWRTNSSINVASVCSNDGFNWPHRTLSWKMLKNDMFGLDFDGATLVDPGETRTLPNAGVPDEVEDQTSEFEWTLAYFNAVTATGLLSPAHDLDSTCLDCHNPYTWNPQYATELIIKGLP